MKDIRKSCESIVYENLIIIWTAKLSTCDKQPTKIQIILKGLQNSLVCFHDIKFSKTGIRISDNSSIKKKCVTGQ